jgi:hypothetical protein
MALLLSVVALLFAAPASDAGAAEADRLAFVGTFLQIEQIPCDSGEFVDADTGEARLFICMDALFRARYRVEHVLEGDLHRGSEVDFQIADHSGFPPMA